MVAFAESIKRSVSPPDRLTPFPRSGKTGRLADEQMIANTFQMRMTPLVSSLSRP